MYGYTDTAEAAFNKINDIVAVSIRLASPEDIRSWSYGEVKKPETINYRTYRSEKDGLFCERIFGPEKDYECFCGKYKGIKHKGIICDKCGVMITNARVRRKRMGHINLAAPVAHIWFFKAMPSRLSNLLAGFHRDKEKPVNLHWSNIKVGELERLIYFQDYIVLDPGKLNPSWRKKLLEEEQEEGSEEGANPRESRLYGLMTDLREMELISEEEYRKLREVRDGFDARMGAEAIREILRRMDLDHLSRLLRAAISCPPSSVGTVNGWIQRLSENLKSLDIESLREEPKKAKDVKASLKGWLATPPPGAEESEEGSPEWGDTIARLRAVMETFLPSGESESSKEAGLLVRGVERLGRFLQEAAGEFSRAKSKQGRKDIVKRLRTVEMLRDSPNRPEWMILDVIPVIPPDLRPLVLLESGNFATSDLNDLYRRLINRNNRLKKLLDLNAPEVIIRNEKRMLQQSVDALFDNQRCRRAVPGTANRPLKSLTDMIKGKQGRFRENLLGKRVDYSARSVIVVGPDLKLHQCGLPKVIALELYQPFIIRRLRELGYTDTIKSAKKMLERREEVVWDILDVVIQNHPVLLNRAPTLHRMGIQAFEPVLVEGNAIRLHPLICAGFNADFDGDQMAVHLPLSFEAQIEASTLMLSTNNIFSPAHGGPIIAPSQDIVLGCFYLTTSRPGGAGSGKAFSDISEVWLAHSHGKVGTHATVKVRFPEGKRIRYKDRDEICDGKTLVETTPGRIMFNDILPKEMAFYNYELDKKALSRIISDCYQLLGRTTTIKLLDDMKELGFKSSTKAGLSFGKDDLRVPALKQKIIEETQAQVDEVNARFEQGVLAEGERYLKTIELWTHAREKVGRELMQELEKDTREGKYYLNPIFCMAQSGARGSIDQVRQLAGMRGLMAKPSGKIIETPIKANFREGLRVLEYFSSTHGARKGLADTALKTADSGYLTRKLADVAQNVVITMDDCGTPDGVMRGVIYRGEKVEISLAQAITGRVAMDTLKDPITDELIVEKGQLITKEIAQKIEEFGNYDSIRVRSPLTCRDPFGLCAKCYGMDLARGKLAEKGLAVGIIAAQSIGEPGTQLTMRTFHTGGIASRAVEESSVRAKRSGIVHFYNVKEVVNQGRRIVLNRKGELVLKDKKGRETERYSLPAGAVLKVEDGKEVRRGQILCQWDPHHMAILAERDGIARYADIEEGKTMKVEKDTRAKGVIRKVIIAHKGDLHPQINIVDENDKLIAVYLLPEKAYIEVEDGQKVTAGTMLAKVPRGISGTQDITGGLPRVTELFEARKPKDPAVMAEIDGIVEIEKEKSRSKTVITVRAEGPGGTEVVRKHLVPVGKSFRVHTGDSVKAGEPLTEGPLVPQDLLRIKGPTALQNYLLKEIQGVYRSQGVTIDDRHIELIIAQMMRRVLITDPGDSGFLPDMVVDKFTVEGENQKLLEEGKRPIQHEPLLQGITKASLLSDSFISAASFQETTKVLTEAALRGKRDNLRGLKENVILGRMVPAGTGFPDYRQTYVKKNVDVVAAAREIQEADAAALASAMGDGVDAGFPTAAGGAPEGGGAPAEPLAGLPDFPDFPEPEPLPEEEPVSPGEPGEEPASPQDGEKGEAGPAEKASGEDSGPGEPPLDEAGEEGKDGKDGNGEEAPGPQSKEEQS